MAVIIFGYGGKEVSLPTEDGTYAVFFGPYDPWGTQTWHSIDRISGEWWDGSQVVDLEWVEKLVRMGDGDLYLMEPKKLVIHDGEAY